MENALFAVPLRKQHVGSVILDEALPRWATEHKLLALAQDNGRWNKILKNLEQQVKQATPTRPEIDGMRTRKDITLIKDKTGTHRALQQMKVGDYALFTDGPADDGPG